MDLDWSTCGLPLSAVDGMAACPKASACSTASSAAQQKARNRVQPDAGPAGNRRAHTKMKQDASSASSATLFIAASASIAAMRKKGRKLPRKHKIKEEVRRLRNYSGGDTIPKKVAVSNYVLLQAQLIDVPNAKCCSSRPILPEMLPHPIVYGSACSGLGTEYWSARAAHPARPFVIAFTCDNSDDSKQWWALSKHAADHIESVECEAFNFAASVTVIVAGFPCRPFSTIGQGTGFDHGQALRYEVHSTTRKK